MNLQSNKREDLEPEPKDIIMIFDSPVNFISDEGLMQTMFLANKMNNLLKKANQNIIVKSYSVNLLEKKAADAKLIYLTPICGYSQTDIELKFPQTPVIVISKKDYGILNAEKLIAESTSLLTT
ncbi:hypothetical protein ACWN8P_00655 [Vagococcus salmoninarum]|nr:hypothetical protein [Vagococcus salmoninarum]